MRTTLTKESLEPTLVITLADYQPPPRYDDVAWTGAHFDSSVDGVAWTTVDTIIFADPDLDPSQPKTRTFTVNTVPVNAVYLRIVFTDANGGFERSDAIAVAPATTFASLRDVRLRLGRAITNEEESQIDFLLEMSTISIYASLNLPSLWTPADTVMPFLRLMCTVMVARSLVNPYDLVQKSETIGSYSYNETYAMRGQPAPGLFLTPAEELAVRRRVFGTNTGSVSVQSLADFYADNIWPYQIAYGLYYGNIADPIVWK